jgi:hypothetical protein
MREMVKDSFKYAKKVAWFGIDSKLYDDWIIIVQLTANFKSGDFFF